MVGRREREDLVRAGEVSPGVSSDSRRAGTGAAGVADLRGPGFLNDPVALKSAMREAARAEGFDTIGFTRPDAVPEAKARLERFLAEGAHGDMVWLEANAARRGDP